MCSEILNNKKTLVLLIKSNSGLISDILVFNAPVFNFSTLLPKLKVTVTLGNERDKILSNSRYHYI